MRGLVGAIALVIALVAGVAGAQASPSRAQRELQPLMDEMLTASNAHDTERFLAPFVHDSTFLFTYNGTMTVGFEQMHAMQLKAWNNGSTDVVYSPHGQIIYEALTPDVVLVTWPLTDRRTLPTGETTTGERVVAIIWQRRREGWRVVQMHESSVH